MRRRRWLVLGSLLLGVGLLGLALAGRDVIARWVHGEPVYLGRPVSYWREVVREHERDRSQLPISSWTLPPGPPPAPPPPPPWRDWTDQAIRWLGFQQPTYEELGADEALPVVIELARDPDEEVRSGVFFFVVLHRFYLTNRLQNPDPRVRERAAIWREQLNAAFESAKATE